MSARKDPLSRCALRLALCGALWLSACASYREVVPPRASMEMPRLRGLSYTLGSVPAGPWPVPDWIAAFQDPQLTALADEVLGGNPDLQIARARIAMAQAQLDQFGATTGVNGSLNASSARAKLPRSTFDATADFNGLPIPVQSTTPGVSSSSSVIAAFNYNLDLWHFKGSVTRSLLSERDAARLDADEARLRLRLSLVSLYCELDQAFAARDLVQSRQHDLDAITRLVRDRVVRGITSTAEANELDVKRAKLQQDITLADERILQTRFQIGVLTGAGPERGLLLTRPHLAPLPATSLPANLPLALLGRRPDIAAARMRVEAAVARSEATKARFYPNINLTAFAGLNTWSPAGFLDRNALLGGVGPAISLPVFQQALLQGQLRGDYAATDAAINLYNKTVNEAYGEVAKQVAALRSADSVAQQQALLLAAKGRSKAIAEERRRRDIGPELDLLQADLAELEERKVLQELDARRRGLQVSLISALGGGFVLSDEVTADDTRYSKTAAAVSTAAAPGTLQK